MTVLHPRKEWCPGASSWAIDDRYNTRIPGEYFCPACGRSVRIPRRGHKVGLVPAHKRVVGQPVVCDDVPPTYLHREVAAKFVGEIANKCFDEENLLAVGFGTLARLRYWRQQYRYADRAFRKIYRENSAVF